MVGQVVTDFRQEELNLGPNQGRRDYALRIVEVLRGPARPGEVVDVQYLLPNWPQTVFSEAFGPTPSCTYLRAEPGETIAIAIGALQPGGPMSDAGTGMEWVQPPTRYNAVGLIGPAADRDRGAEWERELVTLQELLELAPPEAQLPTDADPWWLWAIAALAGSFAIGWFVLRRRRAN